MSNKLDEFGQEVGINADEYAENLMVSLKNKFQSGDIHRPKNNSLRPEELSKSYLNDEY